MIFEIIVILLLLLIAFFAWVIAKILGLVNEKLKMLTKLDGKELTSMYEENRNYLYAIRENLIQINEKLERVRNIDSNLEEVEKTLKWYEDNTFANKVIESLKK